MTGCELIATVVRWTIAVGLFPLFACGVVFALCVISSPWYPVINGCAALWRERKGTGRVRVASKRPDQPKKQSRGRK